MDAVQLEKMQKKLLDLLKVRVDFFVTDTVQDHSQWKAFILNHNGILNDLATPLIFELSWFPHTKVARLTIIWGYRDFVAAVAGKCVIRFKWEKDNWRVLTRNEQILPPEIKEQDHARTS